MHAAESAPRSPTQNPPEVRRVENRESVAQRERAKALELLQFRPDLSPEEAAKRAEKFQAEFKKKFPSAETERRFKEATVNNLEDARALMDLLKTNSPETIDRALDAYQIDRLIIEAGKLLENPMYGASESELDDILKNIKPDVAPKAQFDMTNEDLEKGLADVERNLSEKFYLIDKSIPLETRKDVVDQSLESWRDILKAMPDATLFASTAMYLWGKRMQERGESPEEIPKDFQEIPGDLDAFVPNAESLARTKSVLEKLPGVKFDNNGEFKRYADGSLALSGYLPIKVQVDGREQIFDHDFEFFTSGTNRILKEAADKTDTVQGIKILSLEGLKNQYLNNLAFESRAKRESDSVMDYLNEIGDRPLTKEEAEKLKLTDEEVVEFRKKQEEYWDAQGDPNAKYQAGKAQESMMRTVTGGLKEKVAKRLRNVEAIAGKRPE